jgi:aspartate/tyrosine/aromatic aminotransferase
MTPEKSNNRNTLEQEKKTIAKHLEEIRQQLINHLHKNHQGRPATTCHQCLNFQQGIFADQCNLQDIEKELREL